MNDQYLIEQIQAIIDEEYDSIEKIINIQELINDYKESMHTRIDGYTTNMQPNHDTII